jgi:hypothetical protein
LYVSFSGSQASGCVSAAVMYVPSFEAKS